MRIHTLEVVLRDHYDCDEEDGTFYVPSDTRLTLLITSADSVIPISRMRRLEVNDDYLVVVGEDTRHFIDPDVIYALREEDYEETGNDSRPGFHRG